MNKNWKRAGIGVCTAAALAVGAGLAFSPAANADTPSTATGLVNGVVSGVTGTVNGVLSGVQSGSTTPTVSTTDGVSIGIGGTTVGIGTGNGVSAGVTNTNGSGAGVALGGATTGATGTVGVNNGSGSSTPAPTQSPTPTSSASTAPAMLTALSVTSQYATVYPAKDGYRDTNNFTLNGTASDGQQHYASGTATLTFGSTTVATWPITATNQVINWNGLKGGKLVPGSYTFTARISDSDGHVIAGTDRVAVSAKKLGDTSTLITTKSVSGTHKMAAKPLAGLAHGKVYLKVTSTKVTGVHGKQYLVFKHGSTKIKVRILNGTHTSKYVSIPKSFTTYTISHTWKKGTVKVGSFKYSYKYKSLK